MHSSSQGYPGPSADLYASRGYGDHLMGHNTLNSYSNYLGRDDPYNSAGGVAPGYLNGPPPGLHSGSGASSGGYPGNTLPSLSQHTYPSPGSMSHHFGHHQDVYASCPSSGTSSGRLHPSPSSSSYPSPPVLPSLNAARQHLSTKAYWNNCEAIVQQQQLHLQQQQQQQQQQASANHCYNTGNTQHKSSPSAWARSPNVLSSPSTTPSPIPCPSTPSAATGGGGGAGHPHFSPHASHSASDSHKSSPYNGLSTGSSSSATSQQLNCNAANPLQSLQKMVQIDNSTGSDGSDTLRSPFEMSAHGPQQSHPMLETDPNYPTYYNLDQNRMCATPHSGYSNMSAQSIGSGPFSPSMPTGKTSVPQPPPEMRGNQPQGCVKMESSVDTDDGSSMRSSATSLRFPQSKQQPKAKEASCFINNGSISTDTCSNESLTGAIASAANISKNPQSTADLLGQSETNHDGSFRSSETTRDSIKSSDSEGLSSTYGVSQASTPTGGGGGGSSGPWKMSAAAAAAASAEFRPAIGSSFAASSANNNNTNTSTPNSTSHGKLWWAENGQNMSLAGRGSFADCGQYGNYAGNAQVAAASAVVAEVQGWGTNASTSQQQQQSLNAQSSQLLTAPGGGTFTTQPDGTVIVKKKRGRPFGSKNRRNLEAAAQGGAAAAATAVNSALTTGGTTTTTASQEAYKRRRKVVCIDVAVNTSLSFDAHGNLTSEDTYLFTDHQQQHYHSLASVKHSLPLAMKRKKIVGPVIRIDKVAASDGEERHPKYSVVNSLKFLEEEEKDTKFSAKKMNDVNNTGTYTSRKSIKRQSMLSASPASNITSDKNWLCILCHKGPHYKGLGDLYGPYYVTLDRSKLPATHEYDSNNNNMTTTTSTTPTENNHHEDNDAYNEQQQQQQSQQQQQQQQQQHPASERRSSLRRRQDPNEEASKASGKSIPAANHQQHANNHDEKELGKTNVEVWIHEDCIVWSNNVYLDGTKIRNLEPAIVDSFEHVCTKCKLPGATLGCIFKNCTVTPLHYLCAKEKDCDLDEEKFILSCSKHKKRRILLKEPEVAAVELSEATTTTISEN